MAVLELISLPWPVTHRPLSQKHRRVLHLEFNTKGLDWMEKLIIAELYNKYACRSSAVIKADFLSVSGFFNRLIREDSDEV
ncbi:MAG: hypothetical protein BGO68_00805 [Candidatus Amoebophilus sp. 36-38]|nr:MAG: hypothetical protein BGO68_00805 [Candidatus Amoebophilus sp. 36-38]